MSKLLKYEFRKTWLVKLIVLGLTAVAELVFLLGLWLDQDRMSGIGTAALVMLSFGSVMVIGLYSLLVLHRDMNTKQSYMLFMTPNSSYRILGAKVLENGLSLLLTGGVFFALGALDITLLFAKEGSLEQLWKMITNFLTNMNNRLVLDAGTLASFTFMILSSWFAFVTLTYLADVISAALLSGKKASGLVTFVLIILLEVGVNWINQTAMDQMTQVNTVTLFLIEGVINLVFAAIMYVVTAVIMERRLSV